MLWTRYVAALGHYIVHSDVAQQKWSSCSWLLLREFVKKRQEQEAELQEQIAAGEKSPEAIADLPLPKIPYVS